MMSISELPQVIHREAVKKVPKVWGHEEWIWNEQYCMKILVLRAGHASSYHYHKLKDEVFFVMKGRGRVFVSYADDELGATPLDIEEGDSLHIPTGLRHTIIPITDLTLIECSTHHSDDDSYRVNPGY